MIKLSKHFRETMNKQMDDPDFPRTCDTLNRHGLHYISRSMAARMVSELSAMPAEIRKHLGYDSTIKSMKKNVYIKVSTDQKEAAFATLLDLDTPAK